MTVAPELSPKQVQRVSKCLTGTRNEHRDRCYFYLLLYTGCRVGEPLQLKLTDVLDGVGGIKDFTILQDTKNGKSRRIYFSETLHPYILKYLNEEKKSLFTDEDEYLFTSQQSKGKRMSLVNGTRLIKNAFTNAGLPEYSSHSCRRSTAMMLRRAGIDFEVIATILGHSDLRVTRKYFASSTKEASEALGKLAF